MVAKGFNMPFTSSMNMPIDDQQLMLKYAKGDALAFEQLYARHKGGLYRYCLRQINSPAKAEECFQEIWMKLINSRVNYQPTALFTTYLYRIAQNHIIDCIRKEKKIQQEITLEDDRHFSYEKDQSPDMVSILIQKKQYQQLRTQIEVLPLEQKTALLLKLDSGLSLDEIACVLDCGRETVKSRLRYATKQLKKALGDLL